MRLEFPNARQFAALTRTHLWYTVDTVLFRVNLATYKEEKMYFFLGSIERLQTNDTRCIVATTHDNGGCNLWLDGGYFALQVENWILMPDHVVFIRMDTRTMSWDFSSDMRQVSPDQFFLAWDAVRPRLPYWMSSGEHRTWINCHTRTPERLQYFLGPAVANQLAKHS